MLTLQQEIVTDGVHLCCHGWKNFGTPYLCLTFTYKPEIYFMVHYLLTEIAHRVWSSMSLPGGVEKTCLFKNVMGGNGVLKKKKEIQLFL